mgnify:CR=1 FL=1
MTDYWNNYIFLQKIDPEKEFKIFCVKFNNKFLGVSPRETIVQEKGDEYLFKKEFFIVTSEEKIYKLKASRTNIIYGLINYCESNNEEKVGVQIVPFLEKIKFLVYLVNINSRKFGKIKREIYFMPFDINKIGLKEMLEEVIRLLTTNNLNKKNAYVEKSVSIIQTILEKIPVT